MGSNPTRGLLSSKQPPKERSALFGRRVRVYVDAKILNVHDPVLQRKAFVGYVVEGGSRKKAKESTATESDDAEAEAIILAIEDLRGVHGRITVVCDHESVVSEALLKDPGRQTESMVRLREVLERNRWVKLEVLKANPAHKVVTEYVSGQGREPGTSI